MESGGFRSASLLTAGLIKKDTYLAAGLCSPSSPSSWSTDVPCVHCVQVHYSAHTAAILHSAPLAVLLGIVALQQQGEHAEPGPSYAQLGQHVAFAFLMPLSTILVPAAVGILRVVLLGAGTQNSVPVSAA